MRRALNDPEFDPTVDDIDTDERQPRVVFEVPIEPREGIIYFDKETSTLRVYVDGEWLMAQFQREQS